LQRHDVDVKVEGGFKPYGPMGLGEADRGVETAAGLARG
jgi:hypothetical protein